MFTSDLLVLSYKNNRKWKGYAIQVINPTNGRVRFDTNVHRLLETVRGIKRNMQGLSIIRACNVAKRLILASNDEVYVFNQRNRLEQINQCDWFYKHTGSTNLTSIVDVKTDIEGNIYVCDRESGVHQISRKSCRDSRILLSYKREISTIAIDLKQRRFIIIRDGIEYLYRYSNIRKSIQSNIRIFA
ncbi:hypothetical protein DPMN_061891 [Dreissena polymorpha]|uniref:Uncharacterized protein n=1 Tax=Dreissena polymorpha TaxID=45954 RepID=A0A9D4C7V0_DREPO|nr:hypothetical protein DPMN_061891 [Dreissena polymorpha]